jgi:hypothetical protein
VTLRGRITVWVFAAGIPFPAPFLGCRRFVVLEPRIEIVPRCGPDGEPLSFFRTINEIDDFRLQILGLTDPHQCQKAKRLSGLEDDTTGMSGCPVHSDCKWKPIRFDEPPPRDRCLGSASSGLREPIKHPPGSNERITGLKGE